MRDASASSEVPSGAASVKGATRGEAKPKSALADEVRKIGDRMRGIAFSDSVPKRVGTEIMKLAAQDEAVILKQCAETSRLEGRLEERLKQQPSAVKEADKAVDGQRRTAVVPARSEPGPATFVLVVRSACSNDATSATDIKKKVLDLGRDVGPVKV